MYSYMNMFVLTPVIIFGLIGNVLSMLTWSRGRHRKTSTAVLLTALAVVDTVVLTMPAMEFWMTTVLSTDIRNSNVYVCKVFAFASYFGPSTSSWIVVCITVERFFSIWFPVKVRILCTRTKMCICLIVISLILATIYSPFLIETKLVFHEATNQTLCDWNRTEFAFIYFYTPLMWIDLCFLFMLPFTLIVIANSLILYKILKSKRIMIRHSKHTSHRSRVANAFTIRAIVLSIFFLICLLPVTAVEVIRAHTLKKNENATNISSILLYANSALNFILYCVVGSGFRRDLKTVILNMCTKRKIRLDDLEGKASYVQHSLVSRSQKATNTNI